MSQSEWESNSACRKVLNIQFDNYIFIVTIIPKKQPDFSSEFFFQPGNSGQSEENF